MKTSVIFGIAHMSIGIVIKGLNSVYFKRWPDLFCEVIPGMMMLQFLFGWMDIMIFIKWFHHVDVYDDTPYFGPDATPTTFDGQSTPETYGLHDTRKTPGIINVMVQTVFNFGKQQDPSLEPLVSTNAGMYATSQALTYIALALIPVMLCVKPCCFRGGGGHEEGVGEGDDNVFDSRI